GGGAGARASEREPQAGGEEVTRQEGRDAKAAAKGLCALGSIDLREVDRARARALGVTLQCHAWNVTFPVAGRRQRLSKVDRDDRALTYQRSRQTPAAPHLGH